MSFVTNLGSCSYFSVLGISEMSQSMQSHCCLMLGDRWQKKTVQSSSVSQHFLPDPTTGTEVCVYQSCASPSLCTLASCSPGETRAFTPLICVLQPCRLPWGHGNVLTLYVFSKHAQACRIHLVFSTSALNFVLNQRLKDCSACCSKQD